VQATLPVEKPETAKQPGSSVSKRWYELPDFSGGLVRGRAEVTLKDEDIKDLNIELSEVAASWVQW